MDFGWSADFWHKTRLSRCGGCVWLAALTFEGERFEATLGPADDESAPPEALNITNAARAALAWAESERARIAASSRAVPMPVSTVDLIAQLDASREAQANRRGACGAVRGGAGFRPGDARVVAILGGASGRRACLPRRSAHARLPAAVAAPQIRHEPRRLENAQRREPADLPANVGAVRALR